MKSIRVSLSAAVWAVVGSRQVLADVRLPNVPQGAEGLPDTCIRVLNQALNCDASLNWATETNNFYSKATIDLLCTSDCRASLDGYMEQVKSACETSRYSGPDGLSYHAGYTAQLVWERFNILCTSNPAGENCNLLLGKLAGIDPENQQPTAAGDPNLMCNDCALSVVKTQVEMPLRSNADISSALSSIASSCKTTVAVTPPPAASPPWIALGTAPIATSTATPACAGKTYILQDGDTCQSVAQTQRINTAQLLMANNLIAGCYNFPTAAGTALCIPSADTCDPYVVKSGDTCTTIANIAKATWVQIVSWNADLGRYCQNVRRYAGKVVCISNPGSSRDGSGSGITASAIAPGKASTTTSAID
ncbi:FluG domain-containing protein [Colletotrichum kahawae]|uniref:FluG domain-containing protein n=1 Tax=Colletotrichum kahawae TaxID=34407 RepID=A0AAD9Y7H0_COLKA|nr:FluG domain-containing protein [Colletotrichum kahawae]